jgi:rRNA-processing protein FCF1
MKVIVDTSSILFAFSNGHDIFEHVEQQLPGRDILISKGVINELKGIAQQPTAIGITAKTSLVAIGIKDINVADANISVDSWILSAAKRDKTISVITNDTALIKKLRASGVKALKIARNGMLK